MKRQLGELEQLFQRYLDDDPVQREMDATASAVEAYNHGQEQLGQELEREQEELRRLLLPVREVEAKLKALDDRLASTEAPADADAVEAYNQLVQQRNALVEQHGGLTEAYKERELAYNQRVSQLEQDSQRRRVEVEAGQARVSKLVDSYNRWMEDEGPNRLFKQVNQVMAAARASDRDDGEHADIRSRCRRLRRALSELAIQEHRERPEGLLLRRAVLCDVERCFVDGCCAEARAKPECVGEECTFVVDNGASLTTLTPEMVDALGIGRYVGDKVQIHLPAGLKVKAPRTFFPRIMVGDQSALSIKGAVLEESMPGVDGSLGLSFLNRFDYQIHKDELVLPAAQPRSDAPRFDVFISYKSVMEAQAREVYTFLTERGKRQFLSCISIGEVGNADYQKTIDRTLEEADHMVILCSSKAHLESPWVEAEWRMFDMLKRSGIKPGNIINLLCDDMNLADLPLALRRYNAYALEAAGWQDELLKMVR